MWGEVRDDAGQAITARFKAPDGYTLTVLTALAGLCPLPERILQGKLVEKFRQEFFHRGLPCTPSISNFWLCSQRIVPTASGLTRKC
jgi:hypothetical protein